MPFQVLQNALVIAEFLIERDAKAFRAICEYTSAENGTNYSIRKIE